MERKETYSIGYYQLRVIVMEPTSQGAEHNDVEAIQEAMEILDQVSNYSGGLIGSSLSVNGGMKRRKKFLFRPGTSFSTELLYPWCCWPY